MIGSAYSEISAIVQSEGPDRLEALVAKVADKDYLLLDASYALDEAVVEAALRAGANPNAISDSIGAQGAENALHRAVRGHGSGQFENVARMLLDAGVFVEAKNAARDTPIHAACYEGERRVMALIKLGVDPNTLDDAGQPLLHKAVLLNMMDLAELLLNRGVPIDSRDLFNQTPLLVATRERRIHFIKFLLEHGADMNASDSRGASPKRIALESEEPELELIFSPPTTAAVHAPKSQATFFGCSHAILSVLIVVGTIVALSIR